MLKYNNRIAETNKENGILKPLYIKLFIVGLLENYDFKNFQKLLEIIPNLQEYFTESEKYDLIESFSFDCAEAAEIKLLFKIWPIAKKVFKKNILKLKEI